MEHRKRVKIGRNEACPCGSGNKYKRCCLPLAEAARSVGREWFGEAGLLEDSLQRQLEELEAASNEVLDLLEEGDWVEAEEVCREIRERWPSEIDHLELLAHVRAAQGQHRLAAQLHRQAAEFASASPDFEQSAVEHYLREAAKQEQLCV